MQSLAMGAMPGGSGGGAERGPTEGGGAERGPEAGGMLGAAARGAFAPACGTFGAIGALGASGDFGACGRKSDWATRTAGSAASALPDGVFPDLCPASFAIRKL
jgi:hypothetical protein